MLTVIELKPIFIKSESDREYICHIESDDDLPAVPEENFTQKREVTVDSYSEFISSNDDDSSDDRTVTADSNSSATPAFEEMPCKWEADTKGIKSTLHQVAADLQSAAEGYLALASHVSKVVPYELSQVVAQIPPPPVDVPMPIQKALLVNGESKVVNYLIHGEYELTNTHLGLNYRRSIMLVGIKYIKGKGRPRGSQYRQKGQIKKPVKPEAAISTPTSEFVNK